MYLALTPMSENNDDKDKVNEPELSYSTGNKRMIFFNSFEEENEYNAKQAAAENPVIRLKNTVEIILRVYGFTRESLLKRESSNAIFIDQV